MVIVEGLPARYAVESLTGEGGFGKVYRVFDSHRNHILALKLISEDTPGMRSSLMREFGILSRLQHPNLVRVFDFGHLPQGLFYFTMEFIEGKNLRSYLKERRNLINIPWILEQLLSALGYLHENAVIHGDIKPENIMIGEQGSAARAKLLDFGLIASSKQPKGQGISGTLRFLAPEILLAEGRRNPSTDLYALGAAFIESLEDKDFPVYTEITTELLKKGLAAAGRALAGGGVRNPSSIASLLFDLCNPDPAERPASADAARSSMRTIIATSESDRNGIFTPAFVGREKEREEIAKFLSAKQIQKKVLTLRGPRGVGKQSIIRKAMQSEQLRGRLLFDLSTIPYDYFSMPELLNAMVSQAGPDEREILLAKSSAVSSSAKSLKQTSSRSPIGQRNLVLFNHIIDGLQAIAAHRPLILIVPSIDRLREDYLRFLNQIINHLELNDSNIKMVLSLNSDIHPSDAAQEIIARITESSKALNITIEGFSDVMLAVYLRKTFDEELMSPGERAVLLERSKGLPLALEAAMRHLLSKNIIRFEQDKWILDRALFARSVISIGSDKALGINFQDLDQGQKNLVELFAIFNHELSMDRLVELAEGLVPSSQHAAETLLYQRILSKNRNGRISFAHPHYRELALESCPTQTAKTMNALIANYLVSTEPSRALRIARHFIAAGDLDNAIKYCREVMANLYSTYMPYDCLQLFTDLKALAFLTGNRDQLVQANAWLAPIEIHAGLLSEAINTYVTLIKRESNKARKAQYLLQKAMLHSNLGDDNNSIATVRKAQHLARKFGLHEITAQSYLHLGEISQKRSIYYLEKALALYKSKDLNGYLITLAKLCQRYKIVGRVTLLRKCEKKLIQHADRANDEAKKEIYRCLASTRFFAGDYKSQRIYLEKKMGIEKKQDDTSSLIMSMVGLGGHYYTNGNYLALLSILAQIYSLSMRYGQVLTAANARYNMILAYRMIGDYGNAINNAFYAEKLAKEKGITQLTSIAHIKPAQLFALLGKAKQNAFEASAETLLKAAEKIGNAISLGHYNMCYATFHHINLEHRKALAFADKAIGFFKKAEDRDDIVLAFVQKSIIQVALGKLQQAKNNSGKAVEIYDEIHCEYLRPLLMLGRGMIARCAGDDDAQQFLAEGLRTSRKMGTREITWQLQRELALLHREHGRYHKAMDYYQDAVNSLKQITETLDEEELKVSYIEVPIRMRVFDEIKDLKKQIQKS